MYHRGMFPVGTSFLLQRKPLAGRRALVTGGARRIGRGIALALADAGADIVITYRRSGEEAAQTVRELQALGVQALAVRCYLDNPEAILTAVEQAAAFEGEAGPVLDILINNAGAFETAELATLSVERWDAMLHTNTRAPLLVAQAALPYLRDAAQCAERGPGRIVNIGSLGGLRPWPTHGHYCASKAALHMLTQTMAKAWAPEVVVNCVAPGMIVTREDTGEPPMQLAAKTPMGRNGRTEDIAETVLFLALATPFLTGQVIAVDGGLGLAT